MEKGTSSQASSGLSHEVFLSFRGADTRHGFTDFLYHGLVDVGIVVFRDSESLQVGEEIGRELLQAIESSKMYIPIFSENYVSSKWCLRELAYMIECTSRSNGNKEILPIFLDVEPEDVKLKTNLYREPLSKHQKTLRTEIESWEKALIEVGKLKGWNWEKNKGQGELIRSIIQTVSFKLKVADENVPEHLIGVVDHVEAIIKMLDVGADSTRFLVIHGMGGVGKTTLAKVVFNKISSNFHRCCFLADVRESSKGNNGMVNLQKQLLSKLVGPNSIHELYRVNDGINKLNRGVLRNEKVLIAIDDVDEKEQLRNLARKGSWFGSGSRIIITTRDQSVLRIEEEATSEGPNVLTYEAQTMEFHHALELFSRHAFRRDSPLEDYADLSKKIVSTLGKLPLAIEITGSSLNGQSIELWVETLKKLEQAPPMEVQKKLLISYEKLEHEQRQVFLDIACFFVNKDKTYPIYMWDDCGYHPHSAIQVLVLMSLIKIKDHNTLWMHDQKRDNNASWMHYQVRENNTFWMHDQVRDLGREIVRREKFNNPCKRSRVWEPEQAISILMQKEGSRKIEALIVGRHGRDEDIILKPDGFANLRSLRFFEGGAFSLVGDFNNLLSKLSWLSWQSCPPKFEATNFRPTNLVVLNLSSSDISEEWLGWNQIKMASKLKVLDLSFCKYLKRTPDFSAWVSLERLNLEDCYNLIEIDPSIGKLKLLTCLNLKGCWFLRELPEEIGCLQGLTKIVMPKNVHELPETFGNLKSLLTFDLLNREISKLPNSIGGLVKIRRLDLSECVRLKELPDSIGRLESLVELNLSETSVGHIPESIGDLKQLRVLRMWGMIELTKLPNAIGLLEKLEELDLSWTPIGRIPKSIGDLKQLRLLRMLGMTGLTKLPSAIGLVEKLEELDADRCFKLRGKIPEEIGRLSCLRILRLSCTLISGLPTTLSRLSSLQTLELDYCNELQQLPELPPSLTCLSWTLGGMPLESDTPLSNSSIGTLPQLQTLTLSCPGWPFLPQLPSSLTELHLYDLETTPFPDFSNLENLSTLVLDKSLLSGLSDGIFPTELGRPHLLECRSRDGFQLEMKRLSFLWISRCSFQGVTDLSHMKNLQTIHLRECDLLVEICGLEELGSLNSLWVENCVSLERISDLSKLKKLTYLHLENCPRLRSVEGLKNHLESLKNVTIINAGEFGA